MTTGSETVPGTDANELITGTASTLTSTRTLDTTDVIDGGAGKDTLKVTMTSDFNGFTGDGKMTNVEVLDLTNTSTLGRKFDTLGAAGIEEIKIDANSKGFDVTNLSATGVTVDVSNASAANTTIKVEYAAAANKGTADELTVKFNDAGAAEVAATTTTIKVDQKTVDVVSAGIENLNVVSNGTANFVDLSIGTSKTVTVTGAANLKVDAVDSKVTSVDASAATGDMTLNLSGATVQTVKTGAGDDVVTLNKMAVDAALHGGAGTNKLVIDGAAAMTIQPEMSGFQTLQVQNLTGALMVAGTNTMDLDTLLINDAAGAGNAVTIADLNVSSFTIDLVEQEGDSASGTETIKFIAAADLTVNTSTENDTLKGSFGKTIDAANATSLALNLGADTKTTFELAKATSVSLKATAAQTGLKINAAKATSLEIDSAKTIVFAGSSDFSSVENVVFSNVGGLDISAVKIGAKAQSVSVEASNAKTAVAGTALKVVIDNYANASASNTGSATVVGSSLLANNITIGAGRNEVSVTGGIANDEVVYNTTFGENTEGNVSINLGTISKEDTLKLAAGTNNFSSATVTLSGVDKILAGGAIGPDTDNLVLKASVVSGQTIDIGTATVTFDSVKLDGGTGNDTIDMSGITHYVTTGTGTFTINGEAGNDKITGTAEADIINGGADNDTINGGAGADIITGGKGADTMTGGADADKFVFAAGDSTAAAMDKITDFAATATLNDTLTTSVVAINATVSVTDLRTVYNNDVDAIFTGATAAVGANISTTGILTLTGTPADKALVNTFAEWVAIAEAVTTASKVSAFEFNGNTYVFEQDATADNGAFSNLIELTGVTGIDTLSATAGVNTIVIA